MTRELRAAVHRNRGCIEIVVYIVEDPSVDCEQAMEEFLPHIGILDYDPRFPSTIQICKFGDPDDIKEVHYISKQFSNQIVAHGVMEDL